MNTVATPTGPWAEAVVDRIATLRRALEGIIGVPATEGNTVEVLRNGNEIFPAMLDSIAGAKRTIDLPTFVYWRSEIGAKFAEVLAERARAGARVRVFLDAWDAHQIERSLLTQMDEAGVAHRLVPATSASGVTRTSASAARRSMACGRP